MLFPLFLLLCLFVSVEAYSQEPTPLAFTAEEEAWLEQKPRMVFSEVNWKPLSDVDSFPEYHGIIADYLQVIHERTGIQFEFEKSDTWVEVLKKFADDEIDLIPAMSISDMIGAEVALTEPYVTFPLVIVSRNDTDLVAIVSALNGKKVGVGEGYTSYFYLKHNYPDIILEQTRDVPEGLKMLENGDIDAFVGHIAVVVHAINEKKLDLRISGFADYKFEHRIGIHPDNTLALSVIDKVILSMTPEDHSKILNRWFNLEVSKFDYSIVWYGLGFIVLISGFFLYRYRLISRVNEQLVRIASTDDLTGLANRKRINEYIKECEYRSTRATSSYRYSLILIDLDNFKLINDQYGHDVGDQVLIRFARILNDFTRKSDLVARWGGEEFLIVCDNTDLKEASGIAEKLRLLTSSEQFPMVSGVTASFGVIEHIPGESRGAEFSRVDQKLYEAKRSGKNRVAA